MVGAGMKVNVPADVPVPPVVVTLTVTAPLPAAVTAVICVAELTTKLAACGATELHGSRTGEPGAGDDDTGATARQAPRSARGR